MQVLGSGTHTELPKKLAKEPLLEAIFEMRFASQMPVSTILPGILYGTLTGEKTMEQLPSLSIPKEFRDQDPNFAYVPVCRISWGNYWILIGDRVFGVASKIPYHGWADFKRHILEACTAVLNAGLVQSVSRCSMKYIDILDAIPFEPAACFKLNFSIGGREAHGNNFHVNLGFKEGEVSHTLQVFSKAEINLLDGKLLSGPLLDLDSVIELGAEDTNEFLKRLAGRAEQLHDQNKRIVFDSFSEQALQYLEPTYE